MKPAVETPSPRLAIVLSHPIQYYSPWFRWLRANTRLCFRVFYLSDSGVKATTDEKFARNFAWDVDLTAGYEHEFVPNRARKPDTLRFSGLHNPALFPRLAAWHPDAILLFGYNYRTHLRLIAWSRLKRLPLLFRGDSHLIGRPALPLSKRTALRLLYRQFSAVTFVGAANRRYFEAVGVPDSRLFFAPHAVDDTRFSRDAPCLPASAAALRNSLRIPSHHRVVLFAGKLIPQKQPLELARAFFRSSPPDTTLLFVGDGPEKPALEELVRQQPQASVRLLPFANQSEMPVRYLCADLLVLPSRGLYETWGLSVNEAMHLGIPALVSDQVGCHEDLVTPGVTGWVFPAEVPGALDLALTQALADLQQRGEQIRRAVLERISHYTYREAGEGLLRALAHVSAGRVATGV